MSLFDRQGDLPGIKGVTRECDWQTTSLNRIKPGDIVVIDAPDMGRKRAQDLVRQEPAAVVNVAAFSTGRIPNYGPQLLLEAGITLVDQVGAEAWRLVKDGRKGRLTEDGELFYGSNLVASGTVVTAESLSERYRAAENNLVDHLDAFFGNAIQFVQAESPLYVDGFGVPETRLPIRGRKVLVVSDSTETTRQLAGLKNFIREFEPLIIGCGEGATIVKNAGYTPDIIVGDPVSVDTETLQCGALVVVPADPQGNAIGVERIQDLAVSAVTFPAETTSPTDLALLLADYHQAGIIVNVGGHVDLSSVFVDAAGATPSAVLARLKTARRLVDADAVIELYNIQRPVNLTWLWTLLALFVLAAVVIAVAGLMGSESFASNVAGTWDNFTAQLQRWISQWF